MISKKKHIPIRTCVICREKKNQKDLQRYLYKNGILSYYNKNSEGGRSLYLCEKIECFEKIFEKLKNFKRRYGIKALKEDLKLKMIEKYRQNILGFLGILNKGNKLNLGLENLEEQIKRNKRIYLLIFAEDLGKNSLTHIESLIENNSFRHMQIFTKKELGVALGKSQVGVIFFTDNNVASSIIKKIDVMNSFEIS